MHDVSDGGVAVAVAEMALAGGMGAMIEADVRGADIAPAFFAEDQGLYVITVPDAALMPFLAKAEAAGIYVDRLGRTIANRIIFELAESDYCVTLANLRDSHERFFREWMEA